MENSKVIVARARWVRGSPRKLRWVAKSLGGLTPQQVVAKLKLTPARAARTLLPVFQQALGNAKNNASVSPGKLVVKSIQIGEGPRYKRRDKSHGMRGDSGVRHRKLSHITVELGEYGTQS